MRAWGIAPVESHNQSKHQILSFCYFTSNSEDFRTHCIPELDTVHVGFVDEVQTFLFLRPLHRHVVQLRTNSDTDNCQAGAMQAELPDVSIDRESMNMLAYSLLVRGLLHMPFIINVKRLYNMRFGLYCGPFVMFRVYACLT